MDDFEYLNSFIEAIVSDKLCIEDASGLLMHTKELLETVKRKRLVVGGVRHTIRKTGRPNAVRSMIAKRSARLHQMSRKRAMQKFHRSAKYRLLKMNMQRWRKSHPVHHGMAKMHSQKAFHPPSVKHATPHAAQHTRHI